MFEIYTSMCLLSMTFWDLYMWYGKFDETPYTRKADFELLQLKFHMNERFSAQTSRSHIFS